MAKLKALLKKFIGDKNNREISGNVIMTLAIKGVAMLVSILTVPTYVKYFKNDTVYGAWLTIAAVFTWINTFDFGIGNGLRNHLVKAVADKDVDREKKFISSAYVSIGALSLLFISIGLAVFSFIDWNTVLKVPKDVLSPETLERFIKIVFSGVVIQFFFLLISSIFYALQRTFVPNLLTLITQILILIYITFARFDSLEAKMTGLSYAYVLAHNLPLLVATIILFCGKLREVKPSIKSFGFGTARSILSLGGVFFLIQISLIALNSSNELYINTFFTPADVTQYNYYHKLFYIIMVFVTLLGQPVWSAVTKAFVEKRFEWIKRLWLVMGGIALLCSVASIALALLYQPIANLWLGKNVLNVELLPVSLFAIMTIEMTIINVVNCFSNGFGKLKCQAICTVAGAILKVPLTFLFARVLNAWPAVILATIVASVPLMVLQPIYIAKYIKNIDLPDNTDPVSPNAECTELPER